MGVHEKLSLELGGLQKIFESSKISVHPPPVGNKCQVPYIGNTGNLFMVKVLTKFGKFSFYGKNILY